jgi:hypothetical protein
LVEANETNQTHSPTSSTDLVKNSKTAKGKKKEKFLKQKQTTFGYTLMASTQDTY